jgi:hypothetical protein
LAAGRTFAPGPCARFGKRLHQRQADMPERRQ